MAEDRRRVPDARVLPVAAIATSRLRIIAVPRRILSGLTTGLQLAALPPERRAEQNNEGGSMACEQRELCAESTNWGAW